MTGAVLIRTFGRTGYRKKPEAFDIGRGNRYDINSISIRQIMIPNPFMKCKHYMTGI